MRQNISLIWIFQTFLFYFLKICDWHFRVFLDKTTEKFFFNFKAKFIFIWYVMSFFLKLIYRFMHSCFIDIHEYILEHDVDVSLIMTLANHQGDSPIFTSIEWVYHSFRNITKNHIESNKMFKIKHIFDNVNVFRTRIERKFKMCIRMVYKCLQRF